MVFQKCSSQKVATIALVKAHEKGEQMKKLNIINLICVGIALILEIIPYGIKMKWADFFFEKFTLHSYFDLTPWAYGDTGPFLCGIFTAVIFIMLLLRLFVRPHKSYLVIICALTITAAIFSAVPAFFGSYTLIGLFITILLGVSTEVTALMCMERRESRIKK